METTAMEARAAFARDFLSGQWPMTELCARYGVSRPTGYKWVERYRTGGAEALANQSRAPHRCPQQTPAAVEAEVLAARQRYGWGARKLLTVLRTRQPTWAWPAPSTVNALLDRHGLLRKQRRHRRWAHPGVAPLQTDAPNQVWPADFKGEFKTGDGRYCYPLTVTDHFSRALLVCHGLPSTQGQGARPVFRTLFRAWGLPDAIRTDNGAPFASTSLHGLSRLSIWWMQLGIVHQRIHPSSPQENGQHERMHRELKRETARPPAASARAQQRRFDAFRERYNTERPHEAIGQQTPATRWAPSARPYPERIAPPDYPAHLEVRRVSTIGTIKLRGQQTFLTGVLAGQDVGLEEVGDGIWNIVYYRTLLARWDERAQQMTGV